MVWWFELSPHIKTVWFTGLLCGVCCVSSLWVLLPQLCKLSAYSNLSVGVNMSVNGCLFHCVRPVMSCWPVQCVPCLWPNPLWHSLKVLVEALTWIRIVIECFNPHNCQLSLSSAYCLFRGLQTCSKCSIHQNQVVASKTDIKSPEELKIFCHQSASTCMRFVTEMTQSRDLQSHNCPTGVVFNSIQTLIWFGVHL